MAYSERIKSFETLRAYMRDFFVYGYKTRSDFVQKSSRTYDNERRRIESYLGAYLHWAQDKNGKRVFFSVDSAEIPQNPLYQAYRSKSFTRNDILLHFFLLDLLEEKQSVTAGQAAEEISIRYGESFDPQTLRGKLREYAEAGLLTVQKRGKALCYSKSSVGFYNLFPCQAAVQDFLDFFSEIAPFAVVGCYLCAHRTLTAPIHQNVQEKQQSLSDCRIRFKHHFLAHTLEDEILLPIIAAMEQKRFVQLKSLNGKSGASSVATGYPTTILVSTQTGRRYVVLCGDQLKPVQSLRLDYIQAVELLACCPEPDELIKKAEACVSSAWGVSVNPREKTERFEMVLSIDEQREPYILARVQREGRGGCLERIAPNRFRYRICVADMGELMSWVKTFTGRIFSVDGENVVAIRRFYRDMNRLARMYREEG